MRALPASLLARFATARRDVAFLLRAFQGKTTPPFVVRGDASGVARAHVVPLSAPVRKAASLATRRVRVERVVHETEDAVSLWLADPTGAAIEFVPGQFLTVVCDVEGEKLRRAYSISSGSDGVDASRVAITIKRVPGGRVSNFINDTIRTGDVLEVLGPSGDFTVRDCAATSLERRFILIAGGSGITPIAAIATSVVAREKATRVVLLYGNRRETDIIFRDALADLAGSAPDRFTVRHLLSEPPPEWTGGVGILSEEAIARELDSLGPDALAQADYYVCGPAPMMDACRAALSARAVAQERIHEERFLQPHLRVALPASTREDSVRVRIGPSETDVAVRAGQTLLEAGLEAGVPMPYSCAMGGCGACKVRLVEGEIAMEEPNCLSREERERGLVLTCIGRPTRPSVVDVP